MIRRVLQTKTDTPSLERWSEREWLVTNGLGGYASGTVFGVMTRSYHGYLIAALPSPFGRTVMVNDIVEQLDLGAEGGLIRLGGGEASAGSPLPTDGLKYLEEFTLELGLPVWRYHVGEVCIEKRISLIHAQNTVHVTYRMLEGDRQVRLMLRPLVHFRPHETAVGSTLNASYTLKALDAGYEVESDTAIPTLRFQFFGEGASLTMEATRTGQVWYREEAARGYPASSELWTPGYFHLDLHAGQEATVVASTESWESIRALPPAVAIEAEGERRLGLLSEAENGRRADIPVEAGDFGDFGDELVLAADQFLIMPAGRVQDAARARAAGSELRTVIAGYHWFTDWGRDTMISLEGLTLTTGRHEQAAWILRAFGHYIKEGLIPNLFPEGETAGLYHTADATLWYFHAIDRYIQVSGDRSILRILLPKLQDIIEHHLKGTSFGIGVDPADGLLKQGADHYALTWMDAKMGDWVVTPRRGKAVEINGLWYNALRILESFLKSEGVAGSEAIGAHAAQAQDSFNKRFWYEAGNHLYDVVDGPDGDDPSCRPNQLLALSLRYPVLIESHWAAIVDVAEKKLVTPVGLRSLAPGDPEYKSKYDGDLRQRDGAYHQGTVWTWLIGPFIDAYMKVNPKDQNVSRFLDGFPKHLGEACVGSISEIFDAETPYSPRGCIAQAWSVAEVLRCWVKTTSSKNHPRQ